MSIEKSGLVERILRIRRLLYLITIILAAVPILVPLPPLVAVTPQTKRVFGYIEGLPSGSIVALVIGVDVGMWPDMEPATVAVVQHIVRRPLKLVAVSFWPDGPILTERAFAAVNLGDDVYGIDYVNLGYLPGKETAMAAFAADIRAVIKSDFYGTPIGDILIMEEINSITDFDVVVYVIQADPSPLMRQWYAPYGIPIIGLTTTFARPYCMPYLIGGQMIGLVSGLRGGAEYEVLMGIKRWGSKSTTAMSVIYLFTVILVMVGNILYLYRERRRSK
jgi:hypothetical protein